MSSFQGNSIGTTGVVLCYDEDGENAMTKKWTMILSSQRLGEML